jgi:hypothetical protein
LTATAYFFIVQSNLLKKFLNAAAVLILGVLPAPLLNLCARIIH